jgi:2-polyprenyl-3-methyl-5-hydroxy-6-metoxy-1,4-benzoquinol methylase
LKNEVLNVVYSKFPTQEKKIKNHFKEIPDMEKDLEIFLEVYKPFMKLEDITAKKLADAYIEMLGQLMYCRKEFITTGEYITKSQVDAFNNTYNDETIMTKYMIALALSQFIWKHHYLVFSFYKESVKQIKKKGNILEVGSGHGLLLLETLKVIDKAQSIDVVDISPSSIRITQNIIKSIDSTLLERINFYTSDINDYQTSKKYDFITIGEVIEHVDNPLKIMKSLYKFLSDSGELFITTCVNCPAIDHIYHFKSINEIQLLIEEAGFRIKTEITVPSENKSEKYIKKFKIDEIYAAILTKKV